jgi:O-antigen/teichoic acid export membrane protein
MIGWHVGEDRVSFADTLRGVRRGRGISAAATIFTNGLRLVSILLVTVLLARSAGASAVGTYSSLVAIATIAQSVSAMGLSAVAVRQLIERPSELECVRVLLAARLLTVPLVFAIAAAASTVLSSDTDVFLAGVVLLAGFAVSAIDIPEIFHQSRSLFQRSAACRFVWLTIFVGPKCWAASQGALSVVLWLTAAEALTWQAALWPLTIRELGVRVLHLSRGDFRAAVREVRSTGGLWISGGFAALSQRIDLLLVAGIAGPVAAGHYAAASRLVEASSIISTAVNTTNFPSLAKNAGAAQPYVSVVRRTLRESIAMAIVLCLAFVLAGPWLVETLYGPSFAPSAKIIGLYAVTLIPLFLRQYVSKLLVVEREYWLSLASHSSALFVVLGVGLLLVPRLGLVGGVFATIAGYSIGLLMTFLPKKRGRLMLSFALRAATPGSTALSRAERLLATRSAR